MTPTTRNILKGISRDNVMHLAREAGIEVIERDLQPFHLYNADEAFVSTTPCCLPPVSHYNNVPVGGEVPGPVTRRLTEARSAWLNHDITCLSFQAGGDSTPS